MSERRLGRGLEALLGPTVRETDENDGDLREIPVAELRPNPYQPRSEFAEDALAELAASIEASGLLQPVTVRRSADGYQLIAGERRWRAVQRLGWSRIPAVIREADDRTLLTLALVENLQRDDLNPIDEAEGYQQLKTEFDLRTAEVARLVGKDRSTVANAIRLLKLPQSVIEQVRAGSLSAGHARALLALTSDQAMAQMAAQAVTGGWSVRDLENRVQHGGKRRGRRPGSKTGPQQASVEARRIEDELRDHLGTDVKLTAKRKGRGQLVISYYSNDDLARLLETILGRPFQG